VELRALAFDVFGTVVDWRGSVAAEVADVAARRGLDVDGGAFADAWRRRYRPSMDRVREGRIGWTNLDQLHRTSLDEVIEDFDLQALDAAERDGLNRAWHRLRPWPDSVAGLTRLHRDRVLATLSNGNVALLVDLARAGPLPFDCILSAELCRAYKPDPRTYRMTHSLLALRPAQVMLVAAHQDDLRAAAAEGLRTAFVRRPLEWGPEARPDLAADPSFDIVANDMEDLADQFNA
jgi:2-haloacid dehalogenase